LIKCDHAQFSLPGRHFGVDLKNRALHTLDLTRHFERARAFPDRAEMRGFDLDTLLTGA
jgi:hypothetical protein